MDYFFREQIKSISRFGRNTVETLSAINEMRAKGVEIVFELEEISTNDSASQLYISILEGVAQEENTIRGDNIRLGINIKLRTELHACFTGNVTVI